MKPIILALFATFALTLQAADEVNPSDFSLKMAEQTSSEIISMESVEGFREKLWRNCITDSSTEMKVSEQTAFCQRFIDDLNTPRQYSPITLIYVMSLIQEKNADLSKMIKALILDHNPELATSEPVAEERELPLTVTSRTSALKNEKVVYIDNGAMINIHTVVKHLRRGKPLKTSRIKIIPGRTKLDWTTDWHVQAGDLLTITSDYYKPISYKF